MALPIPINPEVERMRCYLSSLSRTVTLDWLTGCIEYFKNDNSHYSVNDLQNFVRNQWELSDLRDSSEGSLPQNLQRHLKVTLGGKYAVQIESVINIGESGYSQMQKIRKEDISNIEATEKKPESWEPRPSRMLKLKLCDGPQEAEAIEYRPLRMINEQILPGTKILIIGPVDCRRGIFFLKSENVEVIGGEVDSLLITNHFENVLARTIGLPENPDPISSNLIAADAAAVQPPNSSVSDSQRSTYTPFVAPVPSSVNEPNQRQPSSLCTSSRSTQPQRQQLIHEAFGRRPTSSSSVSELNNSLEGTGWTVDDLLAEGDEVFLDLPEEKPNEILHSYSTSSVVNPTNSVSFANYLPQKGCQSASGKEKSVFKTPLQPAPSSLRQKVDQPSTSNPKNPFFASDEYIDSLQIDDWVDEEMSNFINVPSEPTTGREVGSKRSNKLVSKGTSETKSFKDMLDDEIEILDISLEPTSDREVSNRKQALTDLTKSNPPVPKSNKHLCGDEIDFMSISSKPIIYREDNNKKQTSGIPESISALKTNLDKTQNSRSGSVTSSFKWPQMPQIQSKQFNVSQLVPEQQQRSQLNTNTTPRSEETSGVQESKRGTITQLQNCDVALLSHSLSPSHTNGDDDWADAYISSQNSSFKNKYEEFSKSSTTFKSPAHCSNSSSCSSRSTKLSSSVMGNVKSPKTFITGKDSKVNVSGHDIMVSAGDRASLLQSTTCVGPAISSPLHDQTTLRNERIELKSVSSLRVHTPIIKTPIPFEYLFHLLKLSTKAVGYHKIKATIVSLLSNLKIDNMSWSLAAVICDGTGILEVQFAEEVLDKLIGMTAIEFKKLKKERPNTLLSNKLREILENTKQLLINLNCIFEVKFEADKMAQVVKLSELCNEHVNQLKSRLNNL